MYVQYDPVLGSTPLSDSRQIKMVGTSECFEKMIFSHVLYLPYLISNHFQPVYDSMNVKTPREIDIECNVIPCKPDGTKLPGIFSKTNF